MSETGTVFLGKEVRLILSTEEDVPGKFGTILEGVCIAFGEEGIVIEDGHTYFFPWGRVEYVLLSDK